MNTLSLIAWLGTVLNLLTGSVAGGVNTLATYLHNKYGNNRLDTLRTAYYSGQHLYWVINFSYF